MQDLDVAKKILRERNLSLVVVKEGKTLYESSSQGIRGLLRAIESLNKSLNQASVADKVVGRAAALLLAHSHIKDVYATIISSEGLRVLKANRILVEHSILVPQILDREGKNICPFERFSLTISSVDEAYEQLKAFTH